MKTATEFMNEAITAVKDLLEKDHRTDGSVITNPIHHPELVAAHMHVASQMHLHGAMVDILPGVMKSMEPMMDGLKDMLQEDLKHKSSSDKSICNIVYDRPQEKDKLDAVIDCCGPEIMKMKYGICLGIALTKEPGPPTTVNFEIYKVNESHVLELLQETLQKMNLGEGAKITFEELPV